MLRFVLIIFLLLLSTTRTFTQSNHVPIFTIPSESLFSISPDENYFITSLGHELTLWDAWTGELLWTIETDISKLVWSSDSQQFLSDANDAENIMLWNLDGELVKSVDCDFPIENGTDFVWYSTNLIYLRAWINSTHEGAICSLDDGQILRFTPDNILEQQDWHSTQAELHTERVTIDYYDFVWLLNNNDELIDTFNSLSYNFDGTVWQPYTTYPLILYRVEALNNQGTLLSNIHVFDREGQTISVLEAEQRFVDAQWNSDESLLLTSEIEGQVTIRTLDGELLHKIQNPHADYHTTSVSWNPDNQLFAIHYRKNDLYVYTSHDAQLYRLFPHENPISSFRWDSSGAYILTSSNARDCEANCSYEVYLWTTERELLAIFPHNNNVSARWLHNDRHVLTWSSSTINLWDVDNIISTE